MAAIAPRPARLPPPSPDVLIARVDSPPLPAAPRLSPSSLRNPNRPTPPTAPPLMPLEQPADTAPEDGLAYQSGEAEYSFGGLHWLPLIFVVVPGIGAIVHGDAKGWTDGLVGVVAGLFLWQLAKVPWKMYASSRSARLAIEAEQSRPASSTASESHASELLFYEFFALFLSFLCPVLGVLLLGWSTDAFSTPTSNSLLNRTSIVLYALASGVKPLMTVVDLIMQRTQYLQSKALFIEPLTTRSLAKLKHDVESMRQDVSTLRSTAATRSALDQLRADLDMPLGRLSKAVRRSARNEQGMRNETDLRFGSIQQVVRELSRRVEEEEERVKVLEEENWALRVTPVAAAGTLLIQWLGLPISYFRNLESNGGVSPGGRAMLQTSDSCSSIASNSSSSLGSSCVNSLVPTTVSRYTSFGNMMSARGISSNLQHLDTGSCCTQPRPHTNGEVATKRRKGWCDRLPWNVILLPINAAALTAAYVGAVVIGKDLIPHPPPSLHSSCSSFSSSSTTSFPSSPSSPSSSPSSPVVSLSEERSRMKQSVGGGGGYLGTSGVVVGRASVKCKAKRR